MGRLLQPGKLRCGPAGLLLAALSIFFFATALAAESLPPVPQKYFNDYAVSVSPETASQLNAQLEQFERETSNQIVVAVFAKLQTTMALEDYTTRVFESWKVGQGKLDNGAVLFVFVQDRKMRIQTGYGLEGALPDALCRQILDNEITPRLRAGDFDGGLRAGVSAMMQAARGEYQGTGKTVAQGDRRRGLPSQVLFSPFTIFLIIFALSFFGKRKRGTVYGGSGRYRGGGGWFVGGGGFGGGSWGGGGGGGFSGGGFSGGGGSTGGGGASGSW